MEEEVVPKLHHLMIMNLLRYFFYAFWLIDWMVDIMHFKLWLWFCLFFLDIVGELQTNHTDKATVVVVESLKPLCWG